jgi:glycosyltransferase involved in cell wall biosynthesis
MSDTSWLSVVGGCHIPGTAPVLTGTPPTLSRAADLFTESVSESDRKRVTPGHRGGGWPHVLHAIDPGPTGLPDDAVTTLMRESARQGADVAAAVIVEPGSAAITDWMGLESFGVRVYCYSLPSGRYLRQRARYAETLRDWRPALVHCHGARADLLAGWAAGKLRLPRVSTVHSLATGHREPRLAGWLRRRTLARFDALIAVSRLVRDHLLASGVDHRRVHLVPDALPGLAPPLTRPAARAELGLPEQGLVLGWSGRLEFEEGADILLDALPWLGDLSLTVSLLGDGSLRAMLEELARRLGVADRIRWHGERRDGSRLYTAFDCFVASARHDKDPRPLLEAMAAGVPVVAASVGAVPELLRDDEGIRVPPAAPAALALAIRATLESPAAALERAARARIHVARDFASAPWVTRHANLYRSVLAARRGGAA